MKDMEIKPKVRKRLKTDILEELDKMIANGEAEWVNGVYVKFKSPLPESK